MKQKIIKDAKFKHAWVTREQGIELENLIAGGGSEVGKDLVEQIEQVDSELQELKTNYDNHVEEFKSLQQDESELGSQVQHIQSSINELVRKDTPLRDLCAVEQCAWAKDITDQIDSNGAAIKKLEGMVGGIPGVPSHDILFMTNKEISITLSGQQLIGSLYWYTFEYDISEWDNATYQLEGLIYKNIHKDDDGQHGQVEEKTKKALVTLTYDDTKMYGTIQTPNMLDNGSLDYQLIVTCLWKKVLS